MNGLLDNSETYDINDKQSKLVTVRDKLEAVYTALFDTEYDNMNYETKVYHRDGSFDIYLDSGD